MLNLTFPSQLKEVLVLGAHCDDVEIGCGGTLAALVRARPEVRVNVVVFSGDSVRAPETRAALGALMPSDNLHYEVLEFRDGFFPVEWSSIKERFESLKKRCNPDLVLTHQERDRHQDHRTVCELTWNTFRNHTILEYEIPKYDGDLGQPNVFSPLDVECARLKVDSLLKCFISQRDKRWFTADLFSSLMRLRGMECNAQSGFAEAFYARKLRVSF